MGVHAWRAGTVQRGAKHRSPERLIPSPSLSSLAQTPHPSLSSSHVRDDADPAFLLLLFFNVFSILGQITGIVPEFLQDFSGAAMDEDFLISSAPIKEERKCDHLCLC